jgi:hypothetical protein
MCTSQEADLKVVFDELSHVKSTNRFLFLTSLYLSKRNRASNRNVLGATIELKITLGSLENTLRQYRSKRASKWPEARRAFCGGKQGHGLLMVAEKLALAMYSNLTMHQPLCVTMVSSSERLDYLWTLPYLKLNLRRFSVPYELSAHY